MRTVTHVDARAELEGPCSFCKAPAGSCPLPAASLTIFWAPRVESCIFPSVCPPPREQERPCLVEEVKAMLLEKVTMPRLASPHLPGLHPCPFICLFFFYVSKVLCLNSHLPLPTARQGANPEAAKAVWGGRRSPAPPAGAGVEALGLLAVFLLCLGHPRPPCPAVRLLPKCYLCPQLTCGTMSRHSGCSPRQPRDVVGLCLGHAGREERALDRGKPFPAAKQQSCTDTRSCTGAAI